MPHIAVVVEGQGEVAALPPLLRRYLAETGRTGLLVGKPINTKGRPKLLKDGELERFVRLAASEPGACGVLVLCDANSDPACQLGPQCHSRARAETDLPVRMCLAIREYENWIMAFPDSVFGGDVGPLCDPEGRGAKAAVKNALSPRSYVKPRDQPSLTSRVDIRRASEVCPSFARLLRCVDELAALCA